MKIINKSLIMLGLCAALFGITQITQAKSKTSPMSQMPPTVVDFAVAKQITWQPSTNVTGSLNAINGIMIKSETSGRVTKIYFKSGEFVQKDKPIIQIYPDILQAELQKAQAQLDLSKLDYDRSLKLYDKKYVSKADIDKARTDVTSNEAQVQQLKAELDQTLIKAPFSGQLGLRQVSVGDFLTPGSEIVNLEQLNPIRVDFSIPEIYLNQVKVGQTVNISSRAFPNKHFIGKIYAINSVVDPQSRSLDVRASIPNTEYQLLPGAFVEVKVLFGGPKNVLVVPQTAIVYSADKSIVYKVVNHKAVATTVTLGEKLDNDLVIIKSGLNRNDQIVSDGQVKIEDGANIMSPEEATQMMSAQNKGAK